MSSVLHWEGNVKIGEIVLKGHMHIVGHNGGKMLRIKLYLMNSCIDVQ